MAIEKVMNSSEFIEKAVEIALNYKTVYGNGMYGSLIEENIIAQKARQLPGWYTAQRQAELRDLIGRGYFGFDCVCFVKGILWGWNGDKSKDYGGAKYESNNVSDYGEKHIINNVCYRVSDDFTNIIPGEFLYYEDEAGNNTHCGVYIGEGLAVECTPRWENGVQITAVKNIGSKAGYNERTWKKHGELPYIDYWKIGNRFALNKDRYFPGEKIDMKGFELNNMFQYPWVELQYAGEGGDLNTWCYVKTGNHVKPDSPIVGGNTDITYFSLRAVSYATGTSQPLGPGYYKAVLHANNAPYSEISFEVIDPATASIVEARYANNWVDVSIKGKLNDTAWVGIYPKNQKIFNDSEENESKVWHYTNDIPVKICMNADNRYYATRIRIEKKDALINPENYKAVLFYNSGYSMADQKDLEILTLHPNECIPTIKQLVSGQSAKLEVSSGPYKVGQPINITFYGVDNIDAWIGLYKKGDAYNPNQLAMWCYTSSGKQWLGKGVVQNGIVELSANERDRYTGTKRFTPAGNYELVLFGDGGYTNILAKVNITIVS